MSSGAPIRVEHCPECGAELTGAQPRCWLCGRELSAVAPIVAEILPHTSAPAPAAHAVPSPGFAISTLLILVTLACVSAGLYATAPGLLIPLVVIGVPVLIRGAAATRAMQRGGVPVTLSERIEAFVLSFGVVILILLGGCIAFFFACLTGLGGFATNVLPDNGTGLTIVVVACSLVSLFVMGVLFKKTWPKAK